MRTTVEVSDNLWRVVRIKANKKDTTLCEALEQILKTYLHREPRLPQRKS